MTHTERINYIHSLITSIEDSVQHFDEFKAKRGVTPMPGYEDIKMWDCRASILRRCQVAREEILRLMKELE